MFKNLFNDDDNSEQQNTEQEPVRPTDEAVTPSFVMNDAEATPPSFASYEARNAEAQRPVRSAPAAETSRPRVSDTNTPKPPRKEKKRRLGEGISRAWAVAGTVIAVTVLVFAVIGVIETIGNIRSWRSTMDTPHKAGATLVKVLDQNDFESYQKLLAADAVTANDRAVFDSLQESLDNVDETIVSNFILIRLENGKQYLCSIFFDEDRDEYVVRSMKEVPMSMHTIFVS